MLRMIEGWRTARYNPGMRRTLSLGLLSLVLCSSLALFLTAAPAAAKKGKKEPPPEHVVALFLVAKDKPKEKLFNAIANELSDSPKSLASLRLISSAKLKRALGRAPETAVTKCGADIKCIAKLGKEAKAEQVVYARVQPQGAGVSVQILVVGVSSQIIEKKMSFDIAAAGEVKNAIVSRLADIFPAAAALPPMAATGGEDGDEIPLDAVLPTEPTPTATAAATPELVPPPPPASSQPATASAATPATNGTGEGAPDTTASTSSGSEGQPTTIAAVSVDHAGAPPPPPPRTGRLKLLTYVGIGVAGVGVLAAGGGGYFGLQSKSLKDSIKLGPTGTPQLQASKKQDDANSDVSRANLLFIAGGAGVAVGAILIAVDMALGHHEPTTAVTVGLNPNGVTLGWTF